MSKVPFVILVSIPLKRGRAGEFLALLDDVIAAMRSEDTFVNVVVLQSADDPDTIVLYETWFDRDNFSLVERKRAYRNAYETRLPALLREPRQIAFYDAVRSTARAPVSQSVAPLEVQLKRASR
jgi:quinol monooxygenase YgiN